MMKSYTGFAVALFAMAALLEACGGERVAAPIVPSEATAATLPLAAKGYKVLYSFKGGADGASPAAELLDLNGKLYGTTTSAGDQSCMSGGCGTIFDVTFNGTHRVLHRFTDAPHDGAFPWAALIAVKGALYGTTAGGGTTSSSIYGTVYESSASGQVKVLHSFTGTDGQNPIAPLIEVNGALFGTTRYGGDAGCNTGSTCGTVFTTTLAGKEKVLHDFKQSSPPKDGVWPYAGLTLYKSTLYGVTGYGGTLSAGTFFQISTTGKEKALYSFQGGHDGMYPYGPVVELNGEFYGTTVAGGAYGLGTVYAISPAGKERVLHSFKGSPDGAFPSTRLLVVNGKLYGTTGDGGTVCFSGGFGCGIIFAMSTAGKETILYSFAGGKDGELPAAGLIEVNGTLYGTTYAGGGGKCAGSGNSAGCGTIFAIAP